MNSFITIPHFHKSSFKASSSTPFIRCPLSMNQIPKSTPAIYRDCLRLVKHIAGNGVKANNIKLHIKREFIKNKDVTDEDTVAAMRSNAARGLANYLMIENSQKDEKFKANQKKFVQSEVDSLNKMTADSAKRP